MSEYSDNLDVENLDMPQPDIPQAQIPQPDLQAQFPQPNLPQLVSLDSNVPRSAPIAGTSPISRTENTKFINVTSDEINGLIRKRIEHRSVFIRDIDQPLFDQIVQFRNADPERNRYMDALKQFGFENCGDALVKLVYGAPFFDYILKYKVKDEKEDKARERLRFEKLLLDNEIFMDQERAPDPDFVYIKLVVPFKVLCAQAEVMKVKFVLDPEFSKVEEDHHGGLEAVAEAATSWFRKIGAMLTGSEEDDDLSAPFRVDRLHTYQGGNASKIGLAKVQEEFFSTSRRILFTYTKVVLLKLPPNEKKKRLGVRKLLNDGVFTEFFPLHDGPGDSAAVNTNLRALLVRKWASLSQILRPQPLNDIREYYGEKIGFYFGFLGFYAMALSVAALLGFVVFLYGISNYYTTTANPKGGMEAFAKMFDNDFTLAYTFLMSLWATVFLEYFKRFTVKTAYNWDVLGYEKQEVNRSNFKPTAVRRSPITGKWEKFEPETKYKGKLLASACVVGISIAIVIGFVGLLIWARSTGNLPSAWAAVISVVVILILGRVYDGVALKLTNWENHRTETEWENSRIAKKFLFDFVNNYSTLLYIGLFKNLLLENVAGWGDQCFKSNKVGCDAKGENCTSFQYSCMVDLTTQLAIIFMGKQIISQIIESGTPIIMANVDFIKEKIFGKPAVKEGTASASKLPPQVVDLQSAPQYVQDDVLSPFGGLTDDYNEMAIQFGFVMLFVSSFPLGPLFAFLNNMFEVRFDAMKFVKDSQRPVPLSASSIGVWFEILNAVSFVAVITNAALIALTSNYFEETYLAGLSNREKRFVQLAFVVGYEHVVFMLKSALSFIIPDVPLRIKHKLDREDYIAAVQINGEAPAEDDPEALDMVKKAKGE